MTSQVRPGVGILFKNFQELCQICMRKLLLVQQVNDWWVAHDGVLEVCYVALLLLLLLLLTFFRFLAPHITRKFPSPLARDS